MRVSHTYIARRTATGGLQSAFFSYCASNLAHGRACLPASAAHLKAESCPKLGRGSKKPGPHRAVGQYNQVSDLGTLLGGDFPWTARGRYGRIWRSVKADYDHCSLWQQHVACDCHRPQSLRAHLKATKLRLHAPPRFIANKFRDRFCRQIGHQNWLLKD
jgi:hypothetical protein